MYKIAICDDVKAQTEKMQEHVDKFIAETGEKVELYKFYDGNSLLSCSYDKFDIIFLDIKMPGLTGMETARAIRKKNKHITLIFLTSILQYALDGYRVNALEYLIKPISYKKFKSILLEWISSQTPVENPYTIVMNEKGSYRIELSSLKYIETFERKLLLHTQDDDIYCTKKMKDVEAEISKYGFFRCHTGYLVNMGYIKNVVKLDAVLITGERINISKLKKREFMQELAQYWGARL